MQQEGEKFRTFIGSLDEIKKYEDVVRLRDRFEIIRRNTEEGVLRGEDIEHIRGMAKELAQKESTVAAQYDSRVS